MIPDEDDAPEPRPRRFRRWLKRCAAGLLLVVGGVALIGWAGRAYLGRIGQRELAGTRAELDADDPGWTFDALLARRAGQAPPQDRDAAVVVDRVVTLIPAAAEQDWNKVRIQEAEAIRGMGNRRPRADVRAAMERFDAPSAAARVEARKLRHLTAAHDPLTAPDNPYRMTLPHLDRARTVVTLFKYDALLTAARNDPDAAFLAAHAALNTGRSIGDEPTRVSQLFRIACVRDATRSAAQTLAWGEPTAGLAELQAALRAEADTPWHLTGARGDRARLDRMFARLESGRLGLDDLHPLGWEKPGPLHHAAFGVYKGRLPGDHAAALRVMTGYIEAAKLPHHQQPDALAKVKLPPRPPDDFRHLVTSLLIPARERMAGLRARAELLTASGAIVCERFRQREGRWPTSLEEVPKELLPEIPANPFTGSPVRVHRLSDGVAVVGTGSDLFRNHAINPLGPLHPLGMGWRLWDPGQCGLPPSPLPKAGEGGNPP